MRSPCLYPQPEEHHGVETTEMFNHTGSQVMRQRVCAVVIGAALLLQGCASLPGLKKQAVATSIGHVRAFEGTVVVIRSGASDPERLDLDSEVFVGDVVRTLEHSRCRLGLRDGTLLTMGERSELEMRASAASRAPGTRGQNTRQMVVKVVAGLLRLAGVSFPGAGTAVEVLTALASFAFSPTAAIIEVTPTRVSALSLEGTVRAISLQEGIPGEVVLQPGEGTDIEPGKPPTPPRRWPAERVERVKQATAP
jgi:hypothetical protein